MIKNISLIISTFKREKQLNEIIESLAKQLKNNLNLEIIVCDSGSHYNSIIFNNFKKNLTIRYFDIKKNILSAKRNFGIFKAINSYIILLDDDCIPEQDFLEHYVKEFSNIDEKTILSGIVNYPPEYIKKNNYIKFRDSRHFKHDSIKKKLDLDIDKIVAMNMGFIKTTKIIQLGLFDENFTGYGFEDYEFAFRYRNNGFFLKKIPASIIHDEGEPNFNRYLKKYFHLGRDGMKNLIKVNKISAEATIYYKIENNFLFKVLTKVRKLSNFLLLLEGLIIKANDYQKFYIPVLYNMARLFSYTRGYIDRNKFNLMDKNKDWYE
tara:strand:+ start:40128 stop:41093 length:966 start_codon:yes stop_codon:yes gene_type:complete